MAEITTKFSSKVENNLSVSEIDCFMECLKRQLMFTLRHHPGPIDKIPDSIWGIMVNAARLSYRMEMGGRGARAVESMMMQSGLELPKK